MDSGHEAVLVDVNVATTNGINGTHAEVPEMKTRSKGDAAAHDDSAKPKIRLTRTTAAQNDKDGSDTEKKEPKKNLRSGAGDADEKAAPKEPATAKATAGGAASKASAPTPSAVSKRKAQERDDDSGINSRASSVSNDDVGTPARMRTRSSRVSEIASTSTPAERRGGAARVPLSIYEYDAASFDDDLPLAAFHSKASAQKRKAVVYVEEMEDEEAPQESGAEPAAKRSATFLVSAGAGIVTSLLYPLRKLRSGIAAIRTYRAHPSVADAVSAEPDEQKNSADDAVPATADESMDMTVSETAPQSSDRSPPVEAADTCSLM